MKNKSLLSLLKKWSAAFLVLVIAWQGIGYGAPELISKYMVPETYACTATHNYAGPLSVGPSALIEFDVLMQTFDGVPASSTITGVGNIVGGPFSVVFNAAVGPGLVPSSYHVSFTTSDPGGVPGSVLITIDPDSTALPCGTDPNTTISFTVNPVNTAPTQSVTNFTVPKQATSFVNYIIPQSASDADGDPVTPSLNGAPLVQGGPAIGLGEEFAVTLVNINAAARTYDIRINGGPPGFNGDLIIYIILDDGTTTTAVTITITFTDGSPVISALALDPIVSGGAATLEFTVTDLLDPGITFPIVISTTGGVTLAGPPPANGTLNGLGITTINIPVIIPIGVPVPYFTVALTINPWELGKVSVTGTFAYGTQEGGRRRRIGPVEQPAGPPIGPEVINQGDPLGLGGEATATPEKEVSVHGAGETTPTKDPCKDAKYSKRAYLDRKGFEKDALIAANVVLKGVFGNLDTLSLLFGDTTSILFAMLNSTVTTLKDEQRRVADDALRVAGLDPFNLALGALGFGLYGVDLSGEVASLPRERTPSYIPEKEQSREVVKYREYTNIECEKLEVLEYIKAANSIEDMQERTKKVSTLPKANNLKITLKKDEKRKTILLSATMPFGEIIQEWGYSSDEDESSILIKIKLMMQDKSSAPAKEAYCSLDKGSPNEFVEA